MSRAVLLLVVLGLFASFSDSPEYNDSTPFEYIDQYKDLAVVEMHRTGIPASITMAQAMVESGFGKSKLAKESNNHFGIKCKDYWTGRTYYFKDDDLDEKGNLIKSCFRSYDSVIDSYVDHSYFLKNTRYYNSLFELSTTDYKAWSHGLKKCGYATAKNYGTKLISLIERYHLNELDYK